MPFCHKKIRTISAASAIFLLLCCGWGETEDGLQILGAWARPMAMEIEEDASLPQVNSAIYLSIVNSGSSPDRLLGGETPAARALEIHESFLQGDVMRMREVEGVEVPAKGRVELRPGGLHFMLLDLHQPLTAGDTIALTLIFQERGPMVLRVPVQAMGGL